MSRLDAIFAARRRVLMPFITAGSPSLEATERLIPTLAGAGAGIIELGVPFSDPIADGPVIASSMHAALERGVTPQAVLDVVRRVRERTEVGLVLMVSMSIVNRTGPDSFLVAAAAAGVDGLIVPDIDLRDAERLGPALDRHDLAFAMLVSPTTAPERLARLAAASRGFVYVLARMGITGERQGAPDIERVVAAVRGVSNLPVAAGFGIATREHVRAAARHADGVIVGSALVRALADADDPVAAGADLVRDLAIGLEEAVAG